MPAPQPSPELMRALGRLVRGLSALFWGLPLALVVGVQLAVKNRLELRVFDAFLPLVANGLLFYGVGLLADFQKQERVWTQALDRARVLAMVLTGLAPFLYWHARLPEVQVYSVAVIMLAAFGLMFLYQLNHLLQRLVAMLPDEALRQETMLWTTLNQYLLAAIPLGLALVLLLVALVKSGGLPPVVGRLISRSESANEWVFLLLALLPVATTMALIWKIKETVLDSLFGPGR